MPLFVIGIKDVNYEDQENIIIDQNPKEGAKLSKGGTITLYIPNMNSWNGIFDVLKNAEGNWFDNFKNKGEE